MKLGLRIFICYLTVFGFCLYWPFDWFLSTIRTQYYESVEEPLVDQAHILAAMIGHDMKNDLFSQKRLREQFDLANSRSFEARIYDLVKTGIDTRVYITDESGVVIFDSTGEAQVGEDYSSWRDVLLTLKGEYGARTSRANPDNPDSSVMYVAAPIKIDGEIAGVVSVGKPTANALQFVAVAKNKIYKVSGLALTVAIFLSFVASRWLTLPIKRLTDWVRDVGQGKRETLPKLDSTEIGALGNAFDEMRKALEGKKYVEQYVQTLTHEIKSPLSAIRGAAELLREDMEPERQQHFLDNIRSETGRIQHMVDRMLELAALENRTILNEMEKVDLDAMVKSVLEEKKPQTEQKDIEIIQRTKMKKTVSGDPFLLHQAVSNLVQNSIDFSSSQGRITVDIETEGTDTCIRIKDNGSSIPDFAVEKIFNKFYSLKRPDSNKKSTGLGLNFVAEVAALHNGSIHLSNRTSTGVKAVLRISG